jgi:protocatechuate 3,4-dioxygenase beta subunit
MTRALDPDASGRLLTRRELLALLGASGAALLADAGSARAQGARAAVACVARPRQTEGPFFVDDAPDRSDIRSDARSGDTRPGMPLRLKFQVSQLNAAACTPLSGARIDVWHCDADGRYSEMRGFGSSAPAGQPFLRGYQLTDPAGAAQFVTIYPGAYGGRAVHVHFKIRTRDATGRASDFTSQLYFDEVLTGRVFASEPYARRGRRWMRNAEDGLFRDGGRELVLSPQPDGNGYAATFDVALTA